MLKFPLRFERHTQRRLNADKLKKSLQLIAGVALRNSQARWSVSIPSHLTTELAVADGYRYTATVVVSKSWYRDESIVRTKFATLRERMLAKATAKGWNYIDTEETATVETKVESTPVTPVASVNNNQPFQLPELTDEVLKKYFGRIYDREAHIRIIYDNLKTAVNTQFKTRHHILLKGAPACAKSELFLAFIDWLGDGLIESIDATTMTKAGLERYLLSKAQAGTLKPILIFEEIEKTHADNIACLIQVMDSRGKIQRTNAKTVSSGENSAEKCPIVVWATCNNENELLKSHSGAIHSRFAVQPECERPDRTLMKRILQREIREIGGKMEWVDPVLTFCFDELADLPKFKEKFNDPRFARSLLAGGDRLLDPNGSLADFRKAMKVPTKVI